MAEYSRGCHILLQGMVWINRSPELEMECRLNATQGNASLGRHERVMLFVPEVTAGRDVFQVSETTKSKSTTNFKSHLN